MLQLFEICKKCARNLNHKTFKTVPQLAYKSEEVSAFLALNAKSKTTVPETFQNKADLYGNLRLS